MSIHIRKQNDVTEWDAKQFANLPIAYDQGTIYLLDANPTVKRVDTDSIDTPNYTRRTCSEYHIIEAIRVINTLKREQADIFLEINLGLVAASAHQLEHTPLQHSIASIYGRMLSEGEELDGSRLPIRACSRGGNPNIKTHTSALDRVPTGFDPTFHKRGRRIRPRFKRNDTHPDLLDSSWIGSPSKHPSEIQHV